MIRRAVPGFVVASLVLPVVITMVALVIQLVALPQAPDTITIHWAINGTPNGFAPAWTSLVLTAALGLGLPVLLGATTLPGLLRGERGPSYRFMGALALAISAGISTLVTWMLCVQVGLSNATDARLSALSGLVMAGVTALAGVVGWGIQPKRQTVRSAAAAVAPHTLSPGQRAVWSAETSMPRIGQIGIAVLILSVWGSAISVWMTTDPTPLAWLLTAVGLLVLAAAATTLAFRVRVDRRGLSVTSVFGFPRFTVPLDGIASVSAVQVEPVGQFGGYGLRSAPGRFGVVLRRGEAIEVERHSGRRFVVTVDNAQTGAALLQGLLAQNPASRSE